MASNALVAGATGLVGRELVSQLAESKLYNSVHVLTRRHFNIMHPKIISHVIDFENLEKFKCETAIQDVYVCLGTTIKKAGSQENFKKVDFEYVVTLAKWAKENKVEKFALISSMGANHLSKINFYLRTKGQVEQALQQWNFKNLIILRPSLLLGEREEFRLAEKISSIIFKPLLPLMMGKMRKYRPVQARNVAAAMIYFTNNCDSPVRIVENIEIIDI